MVRRIQFTGYQTLYPNTVYFQITDRANITILSVSRFIAPGTEQVIDLIRKEAQNLTSSDPDLTMEPNSIIELRQLLLGMPKGLELISQNDLGVVSFLRDHFYCCDEGSSYLWMVGGILGRQDLPTYDRVRKIGPMVYEQDLLKNGREVWNLRLAINEKKRVVSENTIDYCLEGIYPDSELFRASCNRAIKSNQCSKNGNGDRTCNEDRILVEILTGMRTLYQALGKDLDVSFLYDDSFTSLADNSLFLMSKMQKSPQFRDLCEVGMGRQLGPLDLVKDAPRYYSKANVA